MSYQIGITVRKEPVAAYYRLKNDACPFFEARPASKIGYYRTKNVRLKKSSFYETLAQEQNTHQETIVEMRASVKKTQEDWDEKTREVELRRAEPTEPG